MHRNLISKSKRSTSNASIIILGIILFSFFIYLLNINFQPKTNIEEKIKITGFFVLALVIIYCIYYLLNQKRIYVYESFFEIKRLLITKRYYYAEVKTYFYENFESENTSWTEHYLILKTDEKITLIESEYANFYTFHAEIIMRIKKDK